MSKILLFIIILFLLSKILYCIWIWVRYLRLLNRLYVWGLWFCQLVSALRYLLWLRSLNCCYRGYFNLIRILILKGNECLTLSDLRFFTSLSSEFDWSFSLICIDRWLTQLHSWKDKGILNLCSTIPSLFDFVLVHHHHFPIIKVTFCTILLIIK